MKRLLFCFLIIVLLSYSVIASAHSGGTDSDGGHYDRSTGEYHYHHGYSAHQHYDIDGDGAVDCPYEFKDNTTSKASTPSSSSSLGSSSSSSAASSSAIRNQPVAAAAEPEVIERTVTVEKTVEVESKETLEKLERLKKRSKYLTAAVIILGIAALYYRGRYHETDKYLLSARTQVRDLISEKAMLDRAKRKYIRQLDERDREYYLLRQDNEQLRLNHKAMYGALHTVSEENRRLKSKLTIQEHTRQDEDPEK